MWGHPHCSSLSFVQFSARQHSNTLSFSYLSLSLCNPSLRSQLRTKHSFPSLQSHQSIYVGYCGCHYNYPKVSHTYWWPWRDGKLRLVWSWERRLGLQRERGERESIAVLSGGELDEGRRATMWVSPRIIYAEAYFSVKPILLKCRKVNFHMTLS